MVTKCSNGETVTTSQHLTDIFDYFFFAENSQNYSNSVVFFSPSDRRVEKEYIEYETINATGKRGERTISLTPTAIRMF